jgi:hypothetical protein
MRANKYRCKTLMLLFYVRQSGTCIRALELKKSVKVRQTIKVNNSYFGSESMKLNFSTDICLHRTVTFLNCCLKVNYCLIYL